jgi:hypothetical protein
MYQRQLKQILNKTILSPLPKASLKKQINLSQINLVD